MSQTSGAYGVERVPPFGPVSDEDRADWRRLVEVRAHSHEAADRLAASEVARGRILARYHEDVRELATRIVVVERRDEAHPALLLVDNSSFLRVYLAPETELAHRVARSLLRSGTAYNW